MRLPGRAGDVKQRKKLQAHSAIVSREISGRGVTVPRRASAGKIRILRDEMTQRRKGGAVMGRESVLRAASVFIAQSAWRPPNSMKLDC